MKNRSKRSLSPTVTVALITLIGTIVSAVFASPVIIALIQRTPTPSADIIVTATLPNTSVVASSTPTQQSILPSINSKNITSLSLLHAFDYEGIPYTISFAPNNAYIGTADYDRVYIWNVRSKDLIYTLPGELALSFFTDGKTIATNGPDNTVRLWDLSNGKLLQTLSNSSIWGGSFSPDGQIYASPLDDPQFGIKLWRTDDGTLLRRLEGHTAPIWQVVFSPDGEYLASASGDDETIRIWRVSDGTTISVLRDPKNLVNNVNDLAFSHDRRLLAIASRESFSVWQVDSGLLLYSDDISCPADWTDVSFSPDDGLIGVISGCGEIEFYRTPDIKKVHTLDVITSQFNYCLAFSYDGTMIVTGHDNGVYLWAIKP